jgi:hypothetical protein
MAKLVIEATEAGVTIPSEVLEHAGVRPGDRVAVDLAPLPDARAVQHRAILYAARKLGNAILVGVPAWEAGEWRAELRTPDGTRSLGCLVPDAWGTVIPERSPSGSSPRA